MINFIVREDDLTGNVKIRYTGNEIYFQEVIVKFNNTLQLLSSSKTQVSDFLNYSIEFTLDIKTDGVFNIELFFLEEIYADVDCNLLTNENIYSRLADVDKVYINDFYNIDRTRSSINEIWLNRPVNELGVVYKVKSIERTFHRLADYKQQAVKAVLDYDKCDKQWLSNTLSIINLIESGYLDFTQKVKLFNALKT